MAVPVAGLDLPGSTSPRGWARATSGRLAHNANVVAGGSIVVFLVALTALGPVVWHISPSGEGFANLAPPSWALRFIAA